MSNDGFNFETIDKKWQEKWENEKLYQVDGESGKPKYYVLDMFPYPSAAGLHVGHPEGYTANDILARFKMMNGYEVLHPMGWDAFGLPTENYALKMKIHPEIATAENILNFRRQIKRFGFSYDWSREVNTTDPEYYKWTQWIFVKLFENGLAYEKQALINWCPSCKTGLANEEVVDGKCDRCGAKIERKNLKQWMLRITSYAERLINDLDLVDWPEDVKTMQKNWIGKSTGALVNFHVKNTQEDLEIFTTRPDTIFGVTYMVMSPEHPFLDKVLSGQKKKELNKYRELIQSKSDLERTELNKDKTGISTGLFCINPLTNEDIPIFVADYVMMGYGTGAIMAVPAHDQRDFDFAKKYNISIVPVIEPFDGIVPTEEAFDAVGTMINSGEFNGIKSDDAKEKIISFIEEQKLGKKSIQYKLRDWIFSRQRFWGEPIPIVHCEKCGAVAIPVEELPLKLPDVEFYETSGTGESPLAKMPEWVNTTCPKCGSKAKRETNTMPQWAGSSWYYIRYTDPKCTTGIASKEAINYWLPVDTYIGGREHTNLHLLYVRFWHKFLQDIGVVDCPEPFARLRNQGMVIAEDGRKMSKSLGNVVNPDEVLDKYGADVIRLYEMFMGPFNQESVWNTKGIEGVNRFLYKVWDLFDPKLLIKCCDDETNRLVHKTVKKVTHDIEEFSFNTAISAMMIFVNHLHKLKMKPKNALKILLCLLAPFAPHISEELWENFGETSSIFKSKWPEFNSELCKDTEIVVPIQINGKMRDKVIVSAEIKESELKERVLAREKVKVFIGEKKIVKWIIIPLRLVNLVVK
ncbi:MAG: leucine--tRNA ligase [Caldisericia bacterium]|nr:leucine--tRNA ligase [Caldisericia bacterium]